MIRMVPGEVRVVLPTRLTFVCEMSPEYGTADVIADAENRVISIEAILRVVAVELEPGDLAEGERLVPDRWAGSLALMGLYGIEVREVPV